MRKFQFNINLGDSAPKQTHQEQESPPPPPRQDGFEKTQLQIENAQNSYGQLITTPPLLLKDHLSSSPSNLAKLEVSISRYNASLERIKKFPLGFHSQVKVALYSFLDKYQQLHLFSHLHSNPDLRLSDLILKPSGSILRLALERKVGHAKLPWQALSTIGLGELYQDPDLLSQHPGHILRTTVYKRRKNQLLEHSQTNYFWDEEKHRVSRQKIAIEIDS